MSRGHGIIMQRVLEEVTDEWQPVVYIAADVEGVFDGRVDRSAEESTRRACKRLAALGLVELAYKFASGSIGPDAPRAGTQPAVLVVRKVLSVEGNGRS